MIRIPKARLTILFLTILISGIFGGGTKAYPQGIFRFPLFWVPPSLDPVTDSSNTTSTVSQQVYDGLVAFDQNLRIIPGLAKTWTVSKDGKEYLFTLREGVRFHNGKRLTAEDVVASLSRIIKVGDSIPSFMFKDHIGGYLKEGEEGENRQTSIRALSDNQVLISLKEPYSPFLSVMAMPFTKILPGELASGPDSNIGKHPIGTGPFRFVSWEENVITLKSNPDYFRGAPSLEEVQFRFYPGGDRDEAFSDFLAGDLEGCPLPGSADPDKLRADGFQVLIRPRLSLQFYGMVVNIPPFDNPDVRKALALAFDRETYARDVLGSKHFPAYQILPPGMPGYTPDNALLKYDPEEAARLLDKAGYPQGKGLPELVIASASRSNVAVQELGLFSTDLAKIGIKVKPLFVDSWDQFTKGLEDRKYPMFRYAWYADIPDPDDFLATLFESKTSANYTGFSDPDVDHLLEDARGKTDPLQRVSIYRKAERAILDKAPLIPVLYISTQVVFQGNVQGIDLPANGTTYLPLSKVSITTKP